MNPLMLEQLALDAAARPFDCTCGGGVVEATDLFCGAGGSSLGLEHVRCARCGGRLIRVTQALNHWSLAVEAHNANFPDADHDVHDVEVIPPSRFRRTPIFWASPECVHHAYCRGKKGDDETSERSRATMHDVVRFTEYHRYDAVIVENVVEARLWEPFDAWFQAMLDLGYEGKIVYFNSQFAIPTPQSRDRMYVVFWRKGLATPALDFQPPSWCSECETVVPGQQTWKKPSRRSLREQPGKYEWGRYGAQYIYACPNCRHEVAPAVTPALTAIDWSLPAERIGDRKKPLAPKTRIRIKTGLARLATTEPVTVQVGGHLYERPGYARVWSVRDPLRAVTGTSCMGVVVRAGGNGGGKGEPTHAPMQTITAHDRQMAVVVPGKSGTVPHTAEEPIGAVTTRPHHGLLMQNMENNVGRSTDEPTPPVTTGGNHMLVQVSRGVKSKGENRTRDARRPMPTVAGHGELGLVSMRNHGSIEPADLPVRTVVGGGYHHGLLVYNGTPGHVRNADHDPVGTVTGRDKQSLLVPYYNTGVARSTDKPMGAVTGKDRALLVITEDDIDACLFRMLQWPELLRAQMMHEHSDGRPYELTAQRRDKRGRMRELSNELRVKMIGNAVSSPVAAMLGGAVVEVLRA